MLDRYDYGDDDGYRIAYTKLTDTPLVINATSLVNRDADERNDLEVMI